MGGDDGADGSDGADPRRMTRGATGAEPSSSRFPDGAFDEVAGLIGRFATDGSVVDRLLRDARKANALQRAIRAANGRIGMLDADSTYGSLLHQAEAATADRTLTAARRLTGSFLDHVEPATVEAPADRSVGSGAFSCL